MESWNKAEKNLGTENLPRDFLYMGSEERTAKSKSKFKALKLDGYIETEKGYSFWIPFFKIESANVKPEIAETLVGHIVNVKKGSGDTFILDFNLTK